MEGEVREDRQLMKVEENAIDQLNLEDSQLAEQLYNSAGLDPVVDAGLSDYDKRIERENKLINKVLGPRGADIRGYGESVAKRVAFAIYSVLNKQYGGKVGDMRSYIMTLEEVAAYLRLRPQTIYSWVQDKKIPGAKLGKEWRFRKSIIDEWFLQHIDRKFDEVIRRWREKRETAVQSDDLVDEE